MRLLIDTAVFIWMLEDAKKNFSSSTIRVLENSHLYLSIASLWEISIKYTLGKLRFQENPQSWMEDSIEEMGIKLLGIQAAHVLETISLPFLHKDPFDRLMIAQAKKEKFSIVTPDKIFKKYGIDVIW